MINLTPIVRPWMVRRQRRMQSWLSCISQVQASQLASLLVSGSRTDYGSRYGFDTIVSPADFAAKVPVVQYEDIRADVMRMLAGERNVLWPGRCKAFAQSSGTTGGKSKYIPITSDSFSRNHYAGGADVVSCYLAMNPRSRLFAGRSFILGGSFANELGDEVPHGTTVGDLSANLIANINPVANMVRVPSKRVALMADWAQKLPALVESSIHSNITNISGVPSWFLTVLKRVIERSGASTIHDVWPNLEVFFHGGISFAPYREQYARITDPSKMHYVETYNASEGFFAVQDTPDPAAGMRLLLDVGVFYEFVPLDQVGLPHPDGVRTAANVEEGETYALLITSCNGLWRYAIGDTVRIISADPLRIAIAGRTANYINAFGEELMVHNAEAAMEAACRNCNAQVSNYTAAPVYAGDGTRGRHQWLIEWNRQPDDIESFADELDRQLQNVNSDYQAKRAGGIFLDRLSITTARPGLFDQWLGATGKLGGQRKVPRLSNNREIIDAMLNMNR